MSGVVRDGRGGDTGRDDCFEATANRLDDLERTIDGVVTLIRSLLRDRRLV